MEQYFRMKGKYPEAILLFRVGDFYETFGEDAIKASQALGIILTARNNGGSKIELAGFPYHSLDLYLPRLVKSGFRVAICEQLEKPSAQKKIVKRGVTEVVTPGVTANESLLDHKSSNFLASLAFGTKNEIAVSFLDISTGEFFVSEGSWSQIDKLLQSFQPSEIILSKENKDLFTRKFGDKFYTFPLDEWIYTFDYSREKLLEHFQVKSLKGYGIEQMNLAQISAGAVLHYIATTENKNLKHITSISRIQQDKYVWLDRFTIRNLELLYSPHETGTSLLQILDHTVSPMGGRLLKKWIILPLKDQKEVEARHESVDYFIQHEDFADEVEQYIRQMGDLERLISKVPLSKINPREVVQLKRALEAVEPLKMLMEQSGFIGFEKFGERFNDCPKLRNLIKNQIVEEPPVNLHKGGVIADGFDDELDELRSIIKNAQDILLDIQKTEAERTGITNLKIGFNNVFGYYLEVTNKFKDKAPEEWTRKQTLTNAERYITDDLKKLESKILGAEEKMLVIEQRLFDQLILDIAGYIQPVQLNASMAAELDCLNSFCKIAKKHKYTRPIMNEGYKIEISDGRHPVIEQLMELGEQYVPNDIYLDSEDQQVMMITGPNMSGKSAILRQTALISIMAQMGSFVPASKANLGVIDKVFTRVGASDNISSGESTFMVEMNETASIMNNVSKRSLILLDEIGRGTSTYDGISIAWSIAEFLHNSPNRPKTLFATHYHELNELTHKFPRIKNFNVAVQEIGNKVIFLRKLKQGGSAHSFGIHVAKMAGMPRSIVARANEILGQLETKLLDDDANSDQQTVKVKKANTEQINPDNYQLSIFETVDKTAGLLKEMIGDTDINSMTPIDCMLRLKELKDLLNEADD